MRAFLQRVSEASVSVDGVVTGQIGHGLLVLLGIHNSDTERQAELLARKVVKLRIFQDENGKMNRDISGVNGELLVVSQFTLYGDTRRGNRPSFENAAKAETAKPLYEYFVNHCRKTGTRVATGVFGAEMRVGLVNEGPVTILCETDY